MEDDLASYGDTGAVAHLSTSLSACPTQRLSLQRFIWDSDHICGGHWEVMAAIRRMEEHSSDMLARKKILGVSMCPGLEEVIDP